MQAEYATADAELEDALGDLEPVDDPPLLHAAVSSAMLASSATPTRGQRLLESRFVAMPASLPFARARYIPQ